MRLTPVPNQTCRKGGQTVLGLRAWSLARGGSKPLEPIRESPLDGDEPSASHHAAEKKKPGRLYLKSQARFADNSREATGNWPAEKSYPAKLTGALDRDLATPLDQTGPVQARWSNA